MSYRNRWSRRLVVSAANWIIRQSLILVNILREKVITDDTDTHKPKTALPPKPAYGPPQHWLDMVNRYAPHLLESDKLDYQYNYKFQYDANRLGLSEHRAEINADLDNDIEKEPAPNAVNTSQSFDMSRQSTNHVIKIGSKLEHTEEIAPARTQTSQSPVESKPHTKPVFNKIEKSLGHDVNTELKRPFYSLRNQQDVPDSPFMSKTRYRIFSSDVVGTDNIIQAYARDYYSDRSVAVEKLSRQKPIDVSEKYRDGSGGGKPGKSVTSDWNHLNNKSNRIDYADKDNSINRYQLNNTTTNEINYQQQFIVKNYQNSENQEKSQDKDSYINRLPLSNSEKPIIQEVLQPWPLLPNENNNFLEERWPPLLDDDSGDLGKEKKPDRLRQQQWLQRIEREQKGSAWRR